MSLAKIRQALNVPKDLDNEYAGFKYRNLEDILREIKALMEPTDDLHITDDIVLIGDRYYVKATASFSDLGEDSRPGVRHHTVTAFARETEAKTKMDAAQLTGAASSYARKYALCALFLIDDSKLKQAPDPDSQDNSTPKAGKKTSSRNDSWQSATAGQQKAIKEMLKEKMPESAEAAYKALFEVHAGMTREKAGKIIQELNKGVLDTIEQAMRQVKDIKPGDTDIDFE